jgi:hypothetical protein
MKIKQLIFCNCIAIILFTSCATHEGTLSSGATPTENHSLVDIAIVTASSSQVLGFGGLSKDGLVMEAKRNLYTLFPPKKGRLYANISVDLKKEYYWFFARKEKVFITADIYDLNTSFDSDANNRFIGNKLQSTQNFKLNEYVYLFEKDSLLKVQIMQIFKKDILIKYQKQNGELEIQRYDSDDVIKKESLSGNAKKIGEQVSFNHSDVSIKGQSIFEGNIIAMSKNGYVIEYIVNKKNKLAYKMLTEVL